MSTEAKQMYEPTTQGLLTASLSLVVTKIRHHLGLQTETDVLAEATAVATATVSKYALHENHPLASISGLLEHHPLRDEYLKALDIVE
jgi:hypothetical protein